MTISFLIDFLLSNRIATAASYVIGILGIVTSVVLSFIFLKSRRPSYFVRSVALLDSAVAGYEHIKISHSGRELNNLVYSKIIFWNGGKATISDGDVAPTSPLKIIVRGGKILEAKIAAANNAANNFQIRLDESDNGLFLTFDFVDFQNGVVIDVFHTGKDSDDLVISGDIKGVRRLTRVDHDVFEKVLFKKYVRKIPRRFVRYAVGIISFVMPVMSAPTLVMSRVNCETRLSVRGAILALILFIMYWGMGWSVLHRRTPKGLNGFGDH